MQEAEGFRESQISRARGEAQRFLSVLSAYQVAQDVTVRRLYLETMEEVLRRNPKILIDEVVSTEMPFLPQEDVDNLLPLAGALATARFQSTEIWKSCQR